MKTLLPGQTVCNERDEKGKLCAGPLKRRPDPKYRSGTELEGSTVSQHLMVLRARQIVEPRREGANVYYRVRHPAIFAILDAGREIFADRLDELQASLDADRVVADGRAS